MKRYAAIRKFMIMVLLSILGSYCIGAPQENRQRQIHGISSYVAPVYEIGASVVNYCSKLWYEIRQSFYNVLYRPTDNVKIQSQPLLRKPQVKKTYEQDDSYYLNDDKCTGDGKGDCLFNEKFFGDTFFGTGSENIDPLLNVDYTKYPIVVE